MTTASGVVGARLGFRLGAMPAAVKRQRAVHVTFLVNGRPARVRMTPEPTIHDVLNDTPNTLDFTIDNATPPLPDQAVRVTINSDAPQLLFNGTLQTVGESYQGQPGQVSWPCTAIDDTPKANRRLPFGTWTNVSATTVAQYLVATFAPTFTGTHIQAGLPPVSINLDGSEGMSGALTQIASLIGGYFYWEDGDLHLFLEETSDAPDPIDTTPQRFLDEPPIAISSDESQIRTRVYGKGHGEAAATDLLAGETIVPIADAVMFNPSGGRAISLTQQLDYTGIQIGGAGGIVGLGASPSSPVLATPSAGAGIDDGLHDYAVTFVTASGESLPGPRTTVQLGVIQPPSGAPTVGAQSGASGIEPGDYTYAITYGVADGTETVLGPFSASVHLETPPDTYVPPPASAPSNQILVDKYNAIANPGDVVSYTVTFQNTYGETTQSPMSVGVTTIKTDPGTYPYTNACLVSLPVYPGTDVQHRYMYRYVNGVLVGSRQILNNVDTSYTDYGQVYNNHPPPLSNGCKIPGSFSPLNQVALANIPIGPPGTSRRNVYRYSPAVGSFKWQSTINDNTTTARVDAQPNASLGGGPPAAGTARLNQVTLSNLPVGAAAVTGRKVYRTAAGAAQLKLQQTVANNTATTASTDATADASLGANVPTVDGSNLPPPSGVIFPGATSMIVANPAAFSSMGGWAVIGNGQQTIRYTGLTGSTLTGIPATGPGAIVASISAGSTITAEPALVGVKTRMQNTQLPIPSASTMMAWAYDTYGGGTLPAGTYNYAITYLGASGETTQGPTATLTITPATVGNKPQIIIYGATRAASGAVSIRLYRQPLAGGPFRFLTSFGLIDVIYSDVGPADSALGAAAPTVNTSVGSFAGLTWPIAAGDPVNLFVQRDDLVAQTELANRDGSDGIVEYLVSDERRGEASLMAACDAYLALYARPIVTVTYACRDVKSKSGKPVTINLPSPAITRTLTIQRVDITEINAARGAMMVNGLLQGVPPRFAVTASSVRFSLDAILRKLITGG